MASILPIFYCKFILQIVETQEDGVDGEEGSEFHTVLVGGGEHGGAVVILAENQKKVLH